MCFRSLCFSSQLPNPGHYCFRALRDIFRYFPLLYVKLSYILHLREEGFSSTGLSRAWSFRPHLLAAVPCVVKELRVEVGEISQHAFMPCEMQSMKGRKKGNFFTRKACYVPARPSFRAVSLSMTNIHCGNFNGEATTCSCGVQCSIFAPFRRPKLYFSTAKGVNSSERHSTFLCDCSVT